MVLLLRTEKARRFGVAGSVGADLWNNNPACFSSRCCTCGVMLLKSDCPLRSPRRSRCVCGRVGEFVGRRDSIPPSDKRQASVAQKGKDAPKCPRNACEKGGARVLCAYL